MTSFCISFPGSTEVQAFRSSPEGKFEFTFKAFQGRGGIRAFMEELPASDLDFTALNEIVDAQRPKTRESYLKLIAKTIEHIRLAGLGKIVISRFSDVPIELDVFESFSKLVKAYPNACVYLFSNSDLGTWMGATPEILLKGNHRQLYAMSLAGTATADSKNGFGAKEIEEQSMVTSFIIREFEEAGVDKFSVTGPHQRKAGNLLHLQTEVTAVVPDNFDHRHLLESLHPTPAVAGLPRDEALRYIREFEAYDRELYTGYFGLKSQDQFSYFVNLRCMQVFCDRVRLFAGGGITADSNPDSEWLETEHKMDTLRRILM